MLKRLLARLGRWIEIYNLECELEEQLEYRRAVTNGMKLAPNQLQICNEKISEAHDRLRFLRDGKMEPPVQQEIDHATEERDLSSHLQFQCRCGKESRGAGEAGGRHSLR